VGDLKLVDTGILFINPDPSRYHVWAATAHPVALSETEFIATYQRGAAMYAADSDMAVTRSHDGGITWAHERFICDKQGDDRPYSYHDAMLGRMKDGTLVALGFRIDRTDPDQPMFSAEGGLLPVENVLFTSSDNGATWQGPRVIELPGGLNLTPACPIIELHDGRWLATFDRFKHYDDSEPYQPLMVGFFSSDKGATWGDMVVVADGAPEGKGFWHGRTIPLSDGRLYTMFWAADMTNESTGPINLPNHVSIASADGKDWPMPQAVNLPGQTNYPAQLPDGRLAAVYTWREADQPGTMIALSADGGLTWDVEHQVRLWDATGWTHLGINQADKYPNSHDTIAFGAPTLHTLPDGDLYATWWCTFASITHIRWARLRAE
jgi:hypothetical protein